MTHRRQFLQGLAGIGLGAALPSVQALAPDPNRILVVVELTGANDGFNTLVPYADEAYRAARPELAIPKSELLTIDDHLGLHPSLRGLSNLLEDGQLAIVQGVGYDQPNRSHFESMDIWHTCQRKDEQRVDGWLEVPDRPGLGIEVDRAVLERYRI